jgi:hypothetical protein
MVDSRLRGTVLGLPVPMIDQLRAVQAFKPKQGWTLPFLAASPSPEICSNKRPISMVSRRRTVPGRRKDLSPETMVDSRLRGTVLGLPVPMIDQLRAVQAFKCVSARPCAHPRLGDDRRDQQPSSFSFSSWLTVCACWTCPRRLWWTPVSVVPCLDCLCR